MRTTAQVNKKILETFGLTNSRHVYAAALLFAAKNSSVRGPFNDVSPNPVTMKEFCEKLGEATNRWSWAHAPYFSVRVSPHYTKSLHTNKLQLLLGEVASATTTSLRGIPKVLQDNAFQWKYPTLDEALADLLSHQT